MCLFAALRIFIGKETSRDEGFLRCAGRLCEQFVHKYQQLYPSQAIVFNTHSLLHLEKQVRIHGPLELSAAWEYENSIRSIGDRIKSGYLPLEQLVRRLSEGFDLKKIQRSSTKGILIDGHELIPNKFKDGVFTMKDGSSGFLTEVKDGGVLRYRKFKMVKSAFVYPINSQKLGISCCELLNEASLVKTADVIYKCMVLVSVKYYILIPLSL